MLLICFWRGPRWVEGHISLWGMPGISLSGVCPEGLFLEKTFYGTAEFCSFAHMKKSLPRYFVLTFLLLFVAISRWVPSLAEGYALHVYPVVSAVLSALSSLFPFSLEEVLVVGLLLWMMIYPVLKRRKKKNWKFIISKEVEVLAWIYVWFYLGWGLNYFRYSIYVRTRTVPAHYEEQAFRDFLTAYTDCLNASYVSGTRPDIRKMDREIKEFYRRLPAIYGLAEPREFQRPKYFTFTALYSGVGVLGSMGPFFAESQLNADLLPVQLPFTYAHEFSHLLGVSSEAEANYWAYQACIHSSFPEVRYSGYLGILPYVLVNASSVLSEEQFREWVKTIRPEIIGEYERKRVYWQEKYSPFIGRLQDCLYDWFLKGNRIASGKKNYAEVVGMLLAIPSVSHSPTEMPRTRP